MKKKLQSVGVVFLLGMLALLAGGILTMIALYTYKITLYIGGMCCTHVGVSCLLLSRFATKSLQSYSRLSKIRKVGAITSPIAAVLYAVLLLWKTTVLYYTAIVYGLLSCVPFFIILIVFAKGGPKETTQPSDTTGSDSAVDSDTTTDSSSVECQDSICSDSSANQLDTTDDTTK